MRAVVGHDFGGIEALNVETAVAPPLADGRLQPRCLAKRATLVVDDIRPSITSISMR